jgi:uroporphyrinogen decarboxylase
MCYTPDIAAEVTLQPIRRFGMDAAILFSDILVIPDALGQPVRFEEGKGPVLDPIRNGASIPSLDIDRIHSHLEPVYETVERLSGSLDEETALIGFAGAPWTVATYMVEGGSSRDYATIKKWAYAAPEEFDRLIDVLTEATAAYLARQIDCGAELVQIFDTWAGVLPDGAFERYCGSPIQKIRASLAREHPGVPVIAFPRGAGPRYIDFAAKTGVDGVSLDWSLPRAWAKAELQPKVTVQGNLDPLHLVTGGAAMEAEIRTILDTFADGPFIFNLGHGIVPETPPENVARLAEMVRGWSRS